MVGASGPMIVEQAPDVGDVEETRRGRRRREPIDQPVPERARQRLRDRDREAALAPREHGLRHDAGERFAQHHFRREPSHLPRRRQAGRVLDQRPLEERRPDLEAREHRGAIHLGEERIGQVKEQIDPEQRIDHVTRRHRGRRRRAQRLEEPVSHDRWPRFGPEEPQLLRDRECAEPEHVAFERR